MCPVGCAEGACEVCPCCTAGWCVGFKDGSPLDWGASQDDFDWWAERVLDLHGYAHFDSSPPHNS